MPRIDLVLRTIFNSRRSHIVDNPDRESEIKLLQGYGPHVDVSLVHRLVSLFGDLRSSVDQGLLSYPYSLR